MMIRWAGLCRSVLEGSPGIWVLEGALLFELGLDTLVDMVILVSDSLNRVQERLIDRDRISTDVVVARWAHQWPLSRKRDLADIAVDNCGTLEELTEKAERLYISLTETKTGRLLNDQRPHPIKEP
jgi:dephospho-CoA kinase